MGNSISDIDNTSENNNDVEIKEINKNNPPNPQNFYNNQSLPINSSIKDIINQVINNSHSIFSFRFENQSNKPNNNNNNIQNINIQNIEEHKEIINDNIKIKQNKTSNKIIQTSPKQYNINSNNIITKNIQNPFQTLNQQNQYQQYQNDQNIQNSYNNIIQNPFNQNQQNQNSKKTEYQIKQYPNHNQLEEEKNNPSSNRKNTFNFI